MKKRPEFRSVPAGYEPRYPAALTPDEYRDLLAADSGRRILQAAAAAGIAFGAALPAQGGEREARVLQVFERLGGDYGFWFENTRFESSRNAFGSPVVVPNIPISFGNSHNGVFDAGRARKLALTMFEAYGLKPKAGRVIRDGGVLATLDGYDAEAKVGFKLRGEMPEKNETFAVPEPERARTDLDESEHAALARRGMRIHVADLDSYPLMDNDQFTPTVAYLAGIVDFLNSVTDGPDLDMEAILMARAQRFPLPEDLDLPPAVKAELDGPGMRLLVESRSLVPIRIDPRRAVEVRKGTGHGQVWEKTERPLSTAGRPTLLQLTAYGQIEGSKLAVRVTQGGARPVQVRADGAKVFLPSHFDASKPFELTLELEKGSYWVTRQVQVGVGR